MELTGSTRKIIGKKVRFLRREGLTPVHVFGHGIDPIAVQCRTAELKKVLSTAGTTGIIGLSVDDETAPRNVMVREVQKEPRTGELLHVDLYQVRMEEALKVEVPITLVGEAPALKLKENYLSHELNVLLVECLPGRIPSHIDIDISSLEEAEDIITVRDVRVIEDIKILTNPEQIIARISLKFQEEEKPVAEAVAAGAEEAAQEGSSEEE